jgi:hypothetical protein
VRRLTLALLAALPACVGAPTDARAGRVEFASCDAWILGDGLRFANGDAVDLARLEELLALRFAPGSERPAGTYVRPELPQRIGVADEAPLRAVLAVLLLGAPTGFWGDYVVVCEDGTELPVVRRFEDHPVVMVDFDVEAGVGGGRGSGAAVYVAGSITARSYDAVLLRSGRDALLGELRDFLDREAPGSREQLLVRLSAGLRWGDCRDALVALHRTLPERAIGLLSRRPLYPPPPPPPAPPSGEGR